MAIAESRVRLPGGPEIPYVDRGDPSGAPLVLLHGLTDSWRSYERVLPHLPERVRALVPTQRGHGGAARPEDGYRIEDFAEDVGGLLDALDVEAAVIAGHSSHGFVAQRFAIDHPDRALGVVLVGTPASVGDKPGLRELWDSTLSTLTDPIDPGFVREFQRGTFVRPVPDAFLEAMVGESLKVPARVWRAAFGALMDVDLSRERGGIRAPTLVVWGARDQISPRGDQDSLTAAIPGSRLLVYPGVGHTPQWEDPERLAADLTAFVDEVGGRR